MEPNISPLVYARGTSKYFKFVAIYASIGGTFFGCVPYLPCTCCHKFNLAPRFDQSVVSNSFALPQFSGYFVSLVLLENGSVKAVVDRPIITSTIPTPTNKVTSSSFSSSVALSALSSLAVSLTVSAASLSSAPASQSSPAAPPS